MTRRQPELLVELAADGSHRPVRHHGKGRANIHAGHETGFRNAFPIDALIAQTHAADAPVFDERAARRAFPARSAPCRKPSIPSRRTA